MCSGTFNNPSMKLLVIRDAIPDTPDLITHPPAACSLPLFVSLFLSLSRFLTLFPFDYPCCIFFSVFRSLSIYSPVTASPTFSLVSYRLPFPTALFVSTAIEDNVVGRGENNIDVTEASVYCDDSTMNFCRIGGAMSLRART